MAPGQFLQKCDKRGEVSPCGKPHAARRQYVVEQWNHDFVVHYISHLNNFIEINKKTNIKTHNMSLHQQLFRSRAF